MHSEVVVIVVVVCSSRSSFRNTNASTSTHSSSSAWKRRSVQALGTKRFLEFQEASKRHPRVFKRLRLRRHEVEPMMSVPSIACTRKGEQGKTNENETRGKERTRPRRGHKRAGTKTRGTKWGRTKTRDGGEETTDGQGRCMRHE